MATPNSPSSSQAIIDKFLTGGFSTESTSNPYTVPVTPYVPPSTPDPVTPDPCPEGYTFDSVLNVCVPIEEVVTGDSSNNKDPEVDPNKALFDKMKKDPSTIFGASNILDDYLIDDPNGNILLKFDPSVGSPPPIFGLNIFDSLTGGADRRLADFTEGMQSFMDQGYGEYRGDGTYQVFNPQQYYNTVQGNSLDSYLRSTTGGYSGIPESVSYTKSPLTVGQAVDSVMNPQPQDGSKSSGSPIFEDMSGGLLGRTPLTSVDAQGNRTRNDTAYRAGIARNIERNKRNFGNSKFKEGVGFIGGR